MDPEPKAKVIILRQSERRDQYEKEISEYTQAAVGQYEIVQEKSKIGGKFF